MDKKDVDKLEQEIDISEFRLEDTPPGSKHKGLSEETKKVIEQVKMEVQPTRTQLPAKGDFSMRTKH